MQQVVNEDRQEQEKVRQQQAEARAATKVTSSHQITWCGYSVFYLALRFSHLELGDFVTLQKKRADIPTGTSQMS